MTKTNQAEIVDEEGMNAFHYLAQRVDDIVEFFEMLQKHGLQFTVSFTLIYNKNNNEYIYLRRTKKVEDLFIMQRQLFKNFLQRIFLRITWNSYFLQILKE